ncbi:DUF3035 domain-containing protein [Amaricoccus sp.]|uniref:DUF3035 domain-containing protein n=1 Tax=Amaricoccus sp. TaxID=1872485 RepID=UPI001B4C1E4E|nr:DUF3035 domain-containing protein [Amaricoccus sp.]MBP7001829.1 DUF3035 domain-containing protein [Amaricoccus sp.]
MIRIGRERRWRRIAGAAALAATACALSACQGGGLAGALRSAGVGSSPDEFLVLPTKPLEMPTNLAALPAPTPGAANLVDPNPDIEAVAALTGREQPAGTASAAALVARAGPVDPQIRARLAVEDATYRDENRGLLLERWAHKDSPDWSIYEDMRLDADAQFVLLRDHGVRVPAAPPRVD